MACFTTGATSSAVELSTASTISMSDSRPDSGWSRSLAKEKPHAIDLCCDLESYGCRSMPRPRSGLPAATFRPSSHGRDEAMAAKLWEVSETIAAGVTA